MYDSLSMYSTRLLNAYWLKPLGTPSTSTVSRSSWFTQQKKARIPEVPSGCAHHEARCAYPPEWNADSCLRVPRYLKVQNESFEFHVQIESMSMSVPQNASDRFAIDRRRTFLSSGRYKYESSGTSGET